MSHSNEAHGMYSTNQDFPAIVCNVGPQLEHITMLLVCLYIQVSAPSTCEALKCILNFEVQLSGTAAMLIRT